MRCLGTSAVELPRCGTRDPSANGGQTSHAPHAARGSQGLISGEPSPHRCHSVLNLALRLNQPHKLMICFAMPMHTYICGRAQRCGTCVRTWSRHDTHTASGSQWLSLVSPAHIAIAELYYSGMEKNVWRPGRTNQPRQSLGVGHSRNIQKSPIHTRCKPKLCNCMLCT